MSDIKYEPPVGSQVTDCEGDIWDRREGGWTLWWPEGPEWLADLDGGGLEPWSVVRWCVPLRFTTDEDRKRVGLPIEPAPADVAPDITYEPTREFWTPYEPWMRDVLADGARVSWIDGNECRCDWESSWGDEDGDFDYMRLRIHPDDVPERPTEADPDEALAEAEGRIADLECRAKKAESDLADMTRQRDALGRMADHNHHVAAKVKADRDEWREDAIRNDEDRNKWMAKYDEMRRERNEWRAKHAALRAAEVDEALDDRYDQEHENAVLLDAECYEQIQEL